MRTLFLGSLTLLIVASVAQAQAVGSAPAQPDSGHTSSNKRALDPVAHLCYVPGTPGTADVIVPGTPATPAMGDVHATPGIPSIVIPGTPGTPGF